jgi:hypothetical protein
MQNDTQIMRRRRRRGGTIFFFYLRIETFLASERNERERIP